MRALVVLLCLFAGNQRATAAGVPLSSDAFHLQLTAAARGVAACAADAAACDPAALPPDAKVARDDGTSFHASWLWLREAVAAAKAAPGKERAESMRLATEHLAELDAQAAHRPEPEVARSVPRAQAAAAQVLSQPEFRTDTGPTWTDRQVARLQDWILRLLLGMDRIGTHNPWLAPLIEWTCFLLAAGGLLFSVRRSLARQALRVSLGEGAVAAQRTGRDATNWARLADESARAQRWREAIHHLYWAAIASLEARRAWRPNPTRTPRDYLRLLPSDSAAGAALRQLTRGFEQVWYGHGEATEAAFGAARTSLAEITVAELRRNSGNSRGVPAGTASVSGG